MNAFRYRGHGVRSAARGPEFDVLDHDQLIGRIERIRANSWQARDRYSEAPVGTPRTTREAAARLLRDHNRGALR